MSFGLAASLPGTPPQAPLSPARTACSPKPFVIVPQGSGASPPPRRHWLQKAAGRPPGGRVLVVENDAATGLALQSVLLEIGYRVIGPAESAAEARRLVERTPAHWPIDCALVGRLVDEAARLADEFRRRDIPVAWIAADDPAATPAADRDGALLRPPIDRESVLRTIRQAVSQLGRPTVYVTPPPQEAWPRIFPQL